MPPKVIVLGGGVAGMSAAHELVSRGFEVEVYERSRSPEEGAQLAVNGASTGPPVLDGADPPAGARPDGKPWLPGSTVFVSFPGFYQHIVDTMSGIPSASGRRGRQPRRHDRVRSGAVRPAVVRPAGAFPQGPGTCKRSPRRPRGCSPGGVGSPWRTRRGSRQGLADLHLVRGATLDRVRADQLVGLHRGRRRLRRLSDVFGHGITRSWWPPRRAAPAPRPSATSSSQIVFDILLPGVAADRVLNGPTNDVWIDPWLAHLAAGRQVPVRGRGASASTVQEASFAATVASETESARSTGDYFIGALPVERMAELIRLACVKADPFAGQSRTRSTSTSSG